MNVIDVVAVTVDIVAVAVDVVAVAGGGGDAGVVEAHKKKLREDRFLIISFSCATRLIPRQKYQLPLNQCKWNLNTKKKPRDI